MLNELAQSHGQAANLPETVSAACSRCQWYWEVGNVGGGDPDKTGTRQYCQIYADLCLSEDALRCGRSSWEATLRRTYRARERKGNIDFALTD
jgi:hypothetical protein